MIGCRGLIDLCGVGAAMADEGLEIGCRSALPGEDGRFGGRRDTAIDAAAGQTVNDHADRVPRQARGIP